MTGAAIVAPIDREERERLIQAFLAKEGWAEAERRLLAGDASFRRYERLHHPDKAVSQDHASPGGLTRAVLMDAPAPMEDIRPFRDIARLLQRLGYSAPRILGEDEQAGLLLLEDFGDDTFTRLLNELDQSSMTSAATASALKQIVEAGLYRLAVNVLIDLHKRYCPQTHAEPALPLYDMDRLWAESRLFADWYLPALPDVPHGAKVTATFEEILRSLLPKAREVPDSLVLRDYHVDNLMRLPERPGLLGCGLLDFQDAVLGPVSYDLVSLLEDARRDVAPGLQQEMRERYLAAFPDLDREAFNASYALMGAQRNLKIIGIFTRLSRRDGKPLYLAHIPRVWRLLEADLAHPVLAPLRDWLQQILPPETRQVPVHPEDS